MRFRCTLASLHCLEREISLVAPLVSVVRWHLQDGPEPSLDVYIEELTAASDLEAGEEPI